MDELVQNPGVFYGLAGGVVVLLGALIAALSQLIKKSKEAALAVQEASDANRQLDEVKENRLKLSEEAESTKSELKRIERERAGLGDESSKLRARVGELEQENGAMARKLEQLKRTADELAAQKAEAMRERDEFEQTMRKNTLDAKQLAEHRAELLSRSKSMSVSMKQLLVDLTAWTRAVDEMAGVPAPFDDRTMALRHNINRAFDEYLVSVTGAPRRD